MELQNILNDLQVDLIETTLGCPECCLHCGAYKGFDSSQMRVRSLDPSRLRAYLEWSPIPGVRVADMLGSYVTTHVNTEPLRATNFAVFARLVHELSAGDSQVVAISHGVWAGNTKMEQRLEDIVQLMMDKIVPLLVVTVDLARRRGRAPLEQTINAYVRTFDIVRQALPHARVTASVQGSPDVASPISLERAHAMFEEVLHRLRLSDDEKRSLIIDSRSYTDVGRSALLGLSASQDCDVIPDPVFVRDHLPQGHAWRGMIRFDGRFVVQEHRPGKTYGDSLDESRWAQVAHFKST